MHKLNSLYCTILISLLVSGNAFADLLPLPQHQALEARTPAAFKDITDNLYLSSFITTASDFSRQSKTDILSADSIIQVEKVNYNSITDRFNPGTADNLSIDNLITTGSYQVNEQLSVEGSLISQIATLQTNHPAAYWENQETYSDTNISPSFAMAAIYQPSDKTQIGVSYNQAASYNLEQPNKQAGLTSLSVNSPQKLELGVQHHINNELALAVNANWQKWSGIDAEYDDSYSAGTAVSYQLKNWVLASAFSVDTTQLGAEKKDSQSAMDAQWNLGFGGTRKINNRMSVGVTYQYHSFSDVEISADLNGQNGGIDFQQGVHFISTSLRF